MILKALPFVSVAVSIVVTLGMLVMLAAGCANMKPEKLAVMKWLAISVVAAFLLGAGGATWAYIAGRYGWAAGAGGFPVLYIIVLVIVLVKIEF